MFLFMVLRKKSQIFQLKPIPLVFILGFLSLISYVVAIKIDDLTYISGRIATMIDYNYLHTNTRFYHNIVAINSAEGLKTILFGHGLASNILKGPETAFAALQLRFGLLGLFFYVIVPVLYIVYITKAVFSIDTFWKQNTLSTLIDFDYFFVFLMYFIVAYSNIFVGGFIVYPKTIIITSFMLAACSVFLEYIKNVSNQKKN